MSDTLAKVQAALNGRYAVERELGQGGMATVYLARDDRHDRQVAIKVLKPELASALGPERFLREIRLAAGLQHPHILSVYDSGESDGLLYYVMPFVAGESLRDRLNREQQLPIPDAVTIAREVADALATAHSQGVIHRDIKPENILLSGGHAVVADFGIARAVSRAGEDRLTETGMSIGTPAYMSPEQGAGESGVDGRSDVYSLGCVLYEMLCGQPPFTGPSAMAVLARHSLEAVPSLHIVRHTIPDELEDIVFRALEKVPADRFASARQFAQALAGPAASSGIPTRERLASVPPRRRRRRQVLLGLLIIPVAAGAWFGFRQLQGPRAVETGPDPGHIAVLYFEDRSSGGELGHVADGLTEALIHELSEVSSLSVISSNGVRPYEGAHVTPDSLSRALGVGTLVQGQ
ncbi:MAG: protein kinase domain-containing protein, partial [Gemmatimonadales bacterium]